MHYHILLIALSLLTLCVNDCHSVHVGGSSLLRPSSQRHRSGRAKSPYIDADKLQINSTESLRSAHRKVEHTQRTKYSDYQHHFTTHHYAPTDAQQVITALTGVPGQLVIQWTTFADYEHIQPQCSYGESSNQLHSHVPAITTAFIEPNNTAITRYLHRCHLDGLKADTVYHYTVGSSAAQSDGSLTFHTIPYDDTSVVSMGVVGDWGLVNSQSYEQLQKLTADRAIHMVLHTGDFAYDLHTDDGLIGDEFMVMIEPLASHLPYMGCAGNHEGRDDFAHYKNRFGLYQEAADNSKASPEHQLYFSWDYQSGGATVHMVSINTEFYYLYVDELGEPTYPEERVAQLQWLEADLQQARERGADWIIVYGHRPMYCSNIEDIHDCTIDTFQLRHGVNGSEGIEATLQKYNVDLYLTAHEHSYERTLPVFAGQYQTYSNPNVYTNPKYLVHILSGSAGNQEYIDTYDEVFYGPWSVIRSSTYGFGILTIHNATHMQWMQFIDEGNAGTDELWVTRVDELQTDWAIQAVNRHGKAEQLLKPWSRALPMR